MFFDPGGDGKNIGIKDNVFGGEIDGFGQNLVGPGTNVDFSFQTIGLALFIKGHDHHGRPEATNFAGLIDKNFFAFFL